MHPAPAWRALIPHAALLAALVLIAAAALFWGGAPGIGPAEIGRALLGRPAATEEQRVVELLLFELRLPRVLLMALAGAALAASGAALQAALQNPLVEPSLVGLSAGAALGAVAAHASGLAAHFLPAIPAAAFAGALLAAGAVYLIAHARGRPSAGALLLTGIAASSLCSSLVSVLLLRSGQHRVHEIFAWLLGSADGARWEDLRLSLAPVAIGTVGLFALQRVIDALALGEEHAVSIGVDLHRARALLLLLVALAAGGAVSVTGPIAFVGLMVPHLVRPFTGPATRRLLPAAILGGGAFLVGCDLVARLLSPAVDVPVGVVTALCGVPFFLALLQRARP